MHGFIIGAAIAIGLIWLGRRAARMHGCRHGGWRHRHGSRYGRGRRRRWLWRIFDRLDTSPGQEKAIRGHINALMDQVTTAKRDFHRSGDDLARAMRGESFDEDAVGASFAVQDDALRELRLAFVETLAQIHEILDPEQRAELADMIGSVRRWGGPYREPA